MHVRTFLLHGEVAEWSKATDCKSVRIFSRWFEPNPLHINSTNLLRFKLTKRRRRIFYGRPSHFVLGGHMREETTNIFNYNIPFWLTRPNIHLAYSNKFLTLIKRFDWELWVIFDEMRWSVEGFHKFFKRRLKTPVRAIIKLFMSHIFRFYKWNQIFRALIFVRRDVVLRPFYFIRWSSRSNKPILSLQDRHNKTLLHLYSGIFIKFYEKRKSLRKSKLVTITMFNYFRTVLMFSHYRQFMVVLKGRTPFVQELFLVLSQKPKTLLANLTPEELDLLREQVGRPFSFCYLLYFHNQPYCFFKTRSRGRIKRKIRRRLVRQVGATDL